ncbi:CarD family transcriptional regulator [Clostridia bacterium]|nr:CarD family transcriptional regulator [Clostridia bacterium]
MFNVGDTVLYGSNGVCRIIGIEDKCVEGITRHYYVLRPEFDSDSTIHYLPTDNEKAVGKLKRVLSAEEITKLIQSMPTFEADWIADDKTRRASYKEILAKGDRVELIRMIKSLYARQQTQQEKKLKFSPTDEKFMRDAEKRLYEEFAHVMNIEPDQVMDFIAKQIAGG